MGGGEDTTQTQKTEPWGPAQPYLKDVLSASEQLYGNDVGPRYYPGSTTVPYTQQTMQGLQGIESIAGQGNPLAQSSYNLANQVMGERGLSADMLSALDPSRQIASGQLGIGTGGDYRNLYSQVGQGGPANEYLTATARGDYLNSPNPALRARMDADMQRIADQVNRSVGGTGRYGSGEHLTRLTDNLGDYSNKVLSDDYARERQNQISAAQALESAQMGRYGQQAGLLQGMTGVDSQNIANRLAGGNQLYQGYQGGLDTALRYGALAPQMSQLRYSDAERMMGVGGAYENKLGEELKDNIARYEFENSRPWEQLARHSGLLQGIGGMGRTQVSQQPGTSPWVTGLGGAMAGAQLGSMFGPIGTGVGAIGGGLAGFFL